MADLLSSSTGEEPATVFSSISPLLELSVNAILSRRAVTRDEPSNPTTAYGLDAPLFEKFRDQFWSAVDPLISRDATSPFDLFVYISTTASTPLQRKILLERWQFHFTPLATSAQPAEISDPASHIETHQLLRSVVVALPLLPANHLCQEYTRKPNAFAFAHQVCVEQDPHCNFNTKDLGCLSLAQVALPGLGTLSVDVKYRKNCSSFSKPQDLVVVDTMDESYYPQSQMPSAGAAAENTEKPALKSDLEFYSCVEEEESPEEAAEELDVPEVVEKAFQSCNRSKLSEPEVHGTSTESVAVPDIQQFQQAMHNLQNLDMLTKCTATFSKNDLNTLMMR